jgi:hypothetical protein
MDGSVMALEQKVRIHWDSLVAASADEMKLKQAEAMFTIISECKVDEEVFHHPFISWKFCKLISSDDQIRILNWNVPLSTGEHLYFGCVWYHSLSEDMFFTIPLRDMNREPDKWDSRFFSNEEWPGALYYEIIPVYKRNRKYTDTYTLLGWDGRDNMTNAKVLDVLKVLGDDKLRFGDNIFESPTGLKKRLMFEYADEVSASFKYYPKKKCIVMDHLSPKNPIMTGVFADYGPDGTYDLYQLEKGIWKLYKKIDISLFSANDNKMYREPRRARRVN